jgi:tetratricopeptide (TPR) repeat protein
MLLPGTIKPAVIDRRYNGRQTNFLICLPLIALLAGQMPSRDPSLSAALAELNKGRVLEGIARFKEILHSDPANGAANFYLSTLYTEMGEFEVAERYLRRAMEVNPNQGVHYHQLGLIRYRQKQWRLALGFFKQALEFGAGNNEAAVWRSIGDAQGELFDRDAALQAYETALRIQPQDVATRLALGRFYLERSNPERAIPHLRAAVEIDPLIHAAYPILGRAYRQTGDLPAAMAILKTALDRSPADQESRYALGQVLLAMGRVDEGRAELDTYEKIRLQVASANNNYETAVTHIDAREFAEAEKLLREAVRLAPTYGPALHSLGTLLLDHGSPEKAADILKRAVEANPLNAASWFSLGAAYFKSGKLTEAMEAAKWAVVLNEEDSKYQRLLSEIEMRIRR